MIAIIVLLAAFLIGGFGGFVWLVGAFLVVMFITTL